MRYSHGETDRVWSRGATLDRWLRIQVAAASANESAGRIPADAAEKIRHVLGELRHRLPSPSLEADLDRREAEVGHDVAAFVDVIERYVGEPDGKWVHFGMTSSDVVDTATGMAIQETHDVHASLLRRVYRAVLQLKVVYGDTTTAARTHGRPAEKSTFGRVLDRWYSDLRYREQNLKRSSSAASVGRFLGPTGSGHRSVNHEFCSHLGVRTDAQHIGERQCTPRDIYADWVYQLSALAAVVGGIATDIRLAASRDEFSEPVPPHYKGSSSMPHKRNPTRSERLCGMSRLVRGWVDPMLESVALWDTRDISHSSVDRVVLPSASTLVSYMLTELAEILEGLAVDTTAMIAGAYAVRSTHDELLHLISRTSVTTRAEAYRIIQGGGA